MQFFPIKMMFNDCTLVILTSRLLQKISSITRLFNNSSFAVSNLGLATVVEFDSLPETECDIISCSVKSLRINILTVLNTEVELEISSLHSFSSSENSDSGSWSALPEVLFNFLSCFLRFFISDTVSINVSFKEDNSFRQNLQHIFPCKINNFKCKQFSFYNYF